MALCPVCGNDVADPTVCPVCIAGRAPKHKHAEVTETPHVPQCPRCSEALEDQDWEGIAIRSCPVCRGSFFPDQALEMVLNKLRATCAPGDVRAVLEDFKDRFTRSLPEAIRYKLCPECGGPMTRRNYGGVSGVIVDVCGDHGTWVDEAAFASLADFVSRGGDVLSSEVRRARSTSRPADGSRNLLDHFLTRRE